MSLTAIADSTFEAIASNAPTGLTGTIGVQILDGQGGVTTARTTTGIVETPAGSGTYVATLTAPADSGSYVILWDTGSITPETTTSEDLTVTAGPTVGMYATVADVKAYIENNGIALPADDRIQEIINRAERDIDWVAGPWPIADTTTGRKFTPETLPAYQAQALKFATCAQVEYRLLRGETFMAQSQHQVIRLENDEGASEFRAGQLPYIGPKVHRELALGGLVRSTGLQMVPLGPANGSAFPIVNL